MKTKMNIKVVAGVAGTVAVAGAAANGGTRLL
jgi:hypothetical protein